MISGGAQRGRRGTGPHAFLVAVTAVAAVLLVAACASPRDPLAAADTSTAEELEVVDAHRPSVSTATTAAPATRSVGASAPHQRTRRLTLAVAGDVLVHQAVWESAAGHAGGEGFDFSPMFAEIAPILAGADLALCHLEVPLSPDNSALSSYPRFTAPFQLADALAWAGFDGCSVASNHVLDRGAGGVDSTLGHLDRAGVGHAGAARSPEEAAAITSYSVRGIRIAHLSYTYGYNGLRPPVGEEWRSNLISVDAIVAEAAAARGEGADLVVLSIHWGDEYVHEPNRQQRDVAAALAARADVDLVVGHHAHVVQPLGRVNGLPVIFGLGNFVSNMLQPERRDGVVVLAHFEAAPAEPFGLVGFSAVPTWVAMPGHHIVPAPPDSAARTLGHLGAEGIAVTPLGPGGMSQ